MKKRKPKIIQDKKLRGEWAESVFMERATQHGLAVSKPWGEMNSYDFVVGKSGRFVSLQVKSTTAELGDGYLCTVRGGHKAYRAGSFDFLAAYAVPADSWYIIPAELIRGKKSLTLYPNSRTAKYEKYREAWNLLKEASEGGGEELDSHPSKGAKGGAANETTDDSSHLSKTTKGGPANELRSGQASGGAADEESPAFTPGSVHPGNIEQRMEWVANRVRSWMERRNLRPEKRDEEG